MQLRPKRTNATILSDAELLLFDFLFDQSLSCHHLRGENYSFHMNCLYSHGLDDAGLALTLTSLVDRGLLHCKLGEIWRVETRDYAAGSIYTMTENGGVLWEVERCPDWNRFLVTSKWELGNNCRGMMRIVSPSEDIGRLCMGAMFAAGLISPLGRIRVRTIWDANLLPWKTFGRVNSIRCKINDNVNDAMFPSRWDVYNMSRCWWRDIAELDSLAVSPR
jgi:hypothetical protein